MCCHSHRSGEPVEDAGVDAVEVDAELEGRRGEHGVELAGDERLFDGVALFGEEAPAIGGYPPSLRGRHLVPGARRDDLGRAPARAEAQRAMSTPHELGDQAGGFGVRRRADALVLVEQRRVPQRDGPLATR